MKGKQLFWSLAFLALLAFQHCNARNGDARFVRTSGTRFVMNGRPFYSNGFNAYWLMYMASDPNDRSKVSTTLQEAANLGVTVIRTWAFSDGGYRPLQYSLGSYNEDMFKGLDFVISEAKKHGIYLILSLVNNWSGFGGKGQYVQWARDRSQYLNSEDDFFRNDAVKGYYKNHITAILTRVNTITGVTYKDDPTIFSWELMNEPRCQSDLSGQTLQAWIKEMAAHVKSIDNNHMLEIGLEGFYGESMPDRKQFNPGYEVGTDFIANNQIPGIDFATIHAYPDQWVSGSSDQAQVAFVKSWIQSHTQDAATVLRKPLMLTEFGKSSKSYGYNVGMRDSYFDTVYDAIYESARAGGPCAGALFWHVMAQGMESWSDGYEVVFSQSPSTTRVISQQSSRISSLNVPYKFERISHARKLKFAEEEFDEDA
ncbi:putative mannan endo-1,4-beta-mannosidase 9 [Typha latifolia]|uniref:putative mannan endo-1,4-beta-mannosidase 9 n=1 Tax=Typha latifolia TaxID=4733 RepID=UPI003C2C9F1C